MPSATYATGRKRERWRYALTDPFRDDLRAAGADLPQRALQWSEPVQGEPAFDPDLIARQADLLGLGPHARFEHPLLERAVRVGLAHIDATFQGDHPKYGVKEYAADVHDGFPHIIDAAVDALTLWGFTDRARALFSYWLNTFVRPDGAINYYGTSLSEYGKLLALARDFVQRSGDAAWLGAHRTFLARIADLLAATLRPDGASALRLAHGVPEADMTKARATYFHNNAWIVRGLRDWAHLLRAGLADAAAADRVQADADALHKLLLQTLDDVWPADPDDWWLRPTLEDQPRPVRGLSASTIGGYTNYRYWPELLSSGVLPTAWMERLVHARLHGGGQFGGCSRICPFVIPAHRNYAGPPSDILDNWPLADHLRGLAHLGARQELRLCLWGHICFHQAEGHLTAYESVSFPPGREQSAYCLPSQLVAARAAPGLLA